MSDASLSQRKTSRTARDGMGKANMAGAGESNTTEMMEDKKLYTNIVMPKSWKMGIKYGVPGVAGALFAIAVATGYYDLNTFKSMWGWTFRMVKAIFVWEDY